MAESKTISVPLQAGAPDETLIARCWRMYQSSERALYGLAAVFGFFAIWQWAGTSCWLSERLNMRCESLELFISAPSKVGAAAVKMFSTPDIWNDLYVSGQEFFIGFGLAVVVGIPFGLLLGWYRRFNYVFNPFVSALNATPRVALLPLLIIWFGIGIWSKVAVVFLGGIFPIIINTESGVRALDELWLRAARSFGAKDWQIFRAIALPGAIPFILAGIRVGLGRGLVGIVVGELVGATAGIGYQMAIAGATFQTDRLFVGVFLITGFGVIVTNLVNRLERRFDAWRPQRT